MKIPHLLAITSIGIVILASTMITPLLPATSARGICTGLQMRYIQSLYPTLSKQDVKTGENFTITGKIISMTEKDLVGQLFLQTEAGSGSKFEVLSIEPSRDVINIPGNSVIPYSITIKALMPGKYYVAAGIELVGIGKSSLNNGCPVTPDISVTGIPICPQELAVVLRTEDGSAACVRYTTADALLERGWAKQILANNTDKVATVIIPTNSSLMSYHFTFAPQTVRTVFGENNTVRWINMDGPVNDITSDNGSFRSGTIESGYAWTHTFDKPGTYGYHSEIHPWLKGTVMVIANPWANMKNDTGTITLGNRTYYFETPTYIHDSSFNSSRISFHDVIFTLFPSGFRGGLPVSCGVQYYWTDAKFSDDTNELLHIFAGSQCSVPPLPIYFSNHTNPQAGLTFYDGKMKLLVSAEGSQSELSTISNDCGRFYAAPDDRHNFRETPVLLMTYNSTACARLTFTVVGNYKDCNGVHCSSLARFDSLLHIGDVHYEKSDYETSVSPAKDYTNSFQIKIVPEAVDLANYSLGSKFTVTYIIKPLPNATGFYDSSIPEGTCSTYPLAVGRPAPEVNASDFDYIISGPVPCPAGLYQISGVEIAGMNYTYVKLP